MIRKIRVKAICFFAIICLIVPIFCIQVAAAGPIDVSDTAYNDEDAATDLAQLITDIQAAIDATGSGEELYIGGYNNHITDSLTIQSSVSGQTIIFYAIMPDANLIWNHDAAGYTLLVEGAELENLTIQNNTSQYAHTITISHGTYISGTLYLGSYVNADVGNSVHRGSEYVAPTASLNPFEEEGNDNQYNETDDDEPEPDPIEIGDEVKTSTPAGKNTGGSLTVTITDDEPFEEDGLKYAGKVDIKEFFTDTPKSIPDVVFINGKRYLVGDVVYIVAKKNLEIVGYTKTGLAYIFPAVENVEKTVVFTASSLPEGLALTEDGILYTETLPLKSGITEITVTADNGVDTHEIKVRINIKPEYENNLELKSDLTQNDKEAAPELLDEDGIKKPVGDVLNLWVSGELRLHYDPELADFNTLFLDGRRLIEGVDYTTEEGSTVIVLTEQTMIPLASGDHVVTTMFHQNTDLEMDTVINDVGSSSFVFRFGDDKTSGKRVNIGGDGVTGSVTFDDTASKEEPITTITANSEAIGKRAANLSNATGREIIAAFETKQHGGFGGGELSAGRVATFAVSVKSLNLTLKDGTAVYVAVYDSKTGKTYQNKGEIKDGMIVFRTVHSGVFMVSLEKF